MTILIFGHPDACLWVSSSTIADYFMTEQEMWRTAQTNISTMRPWWDVVCEVMIVQWRHMKACYTVTFPSSAFPGPSPPRGGHVMPVPSLTLPEVLLSPQADLRVCSSCFSLFYFESCFLVGLMLFYSLSPFLSVSWVQSAAVSVSCALFPTSVSPLQRFPILTMQQFPFLEQLQSQEPVW